MSDKEMKPILFSTPMVRAIRDGRKTQTRRVVKPQPVFLSKDKDRELNIYVYKNDYHFFEFFNSGRVALDCAPYKIGDILWVRETWVKEIYPDDEGLIRYRYKADGGDYSDWVGLEGEKFRWSPSIFMPKEAARIFLKVKDVWCERIQSISEKDAIKEGVERCWPTRTPDECKEYCDNKEYKPCTKRVFKGFMGLWDSLNAKRGYGWDVNPWVWVYEFERVTK